MDDKQYLQRLISEGEHQQQDFKYRVSDARKLARSVSAFANTDGGRLLIGALDDDDRPRAYIRIADENIVASSVSRAFPVPRSSPSWPASSALALSTAATTTSSSCSPFYLELLNPQSFEHPLQ